MFGIFLYNDHLNSNFLLLYWCCIIYYSKYLFIFELFLSKYYCDFNFCFLDFCSHNSNTCAWSKFKFEIQVQMRSTNYQIHFKWNQLILMSNFVSIYYLKIPTLTKIIIRPIAIQMASNSIYHLNRSRTQLVFCLIREKFTRIFRCMKCKCTNFPVS